MSEKGDGRDARTRPAHHVDGRRRRESRHHLIGSTDDLGLRAVEDKLHVHGSPRHRSCTSWALDHIQAHLPHKGRPERIDRNEGNPYTRIVA